MSSIRVELSDGMTFSRVRQRNRPPLQFLWTAPESGEYHLNVTSGSGSGSYTVSVSINAQAVNPTGTAAPVPAAAQGVTSTLLASAEQTSSPGPIHSGRSAASGFPCTGGTAVVSSQWSVVSGWRDGEAPRGERTGARRGGCGRMNVRLCQEVI